jgi:RimJ/RimL family protein N-acetyltransferase
MAELVYDQKDRIGAWVAKQVGQGASWGDFYALGVIRGDDIIAGVVINNYNGANATCHIAIAQQTKMIVPLFQAVCDYAFRHCGLKRLTGMVPSNELNVLAFDKHLGFEEEFLMKDGAPGADMHILVLWPDKCRWLRKE